jgi:hypothetical protein
MRKVAINRGRGAELQFRFAECWGFLKGALESGWGDKSPEFMPASDKNKDWKDSTEIARQQEKSACCRFDFRRQSRCYCPLNPGGPRRPCDWNHKFCFAK